MALNPEPKKYYGWRGYKVEVADVELGVAPGIGGRIISLKLHGEELFFVHPKYAGETHNLVHTADLRGKKRQLGHRVFGGDKTWLAPQKEWWENVPPLELDAGPYTSRLVGNSIIMESPVCRETGVRLIRQVELRETGEIVLRQTMINESLWEVRRGIWNVTQFLRPFDVYLPTPPNAVQAYPENGDSERWRSAVVAPAGRWTRIGCHRPALFKFGAMLDCGMLIALRRRAHETLAMMRLFDVEPQQPYAHDAMAEVYNSAKYNYFEIEVHAPLATLAPGAQCSHTQRWALKRLPPEIGPEEVVEAMADCFQGL